jgi:hypothetical protein
LSSHISLHESARQKLEWHFERTAVHTNVTRSASHERRIGKVLHGLRT